MTYGELRRRCVQRWPNINVDLIDSWIQERYGAVLTALQWSRLDRRVTLEVGAQYSAGTVTIQPGQRSVLLDPSTGASWQASMDGWLFRAGDSPAYTFIYGSGINGRIDQDWGPTAYAAGSYSLSNNRIQLPDDCRLIHSVTWSGASEPLRRWTPAELGNIGARRDQYGQPEGWAYVTDQVVELYPVPVLGGALIMDYVAEGQRFDGATTTSTPVAIWMTPKAIAAHVDAEACAMGKDYNGAAFYRDEAERALTDMIRTEAARLGPSRIREKMFPRDRADMAKRTRA